MLSISVFLGLLASAGVALGGNSKPSQHASCTLKASGGDDASAFLNAVNHCSTVVIPEQTTLNISTRLNMTGIRDKHIDLKGTIRFNPDIPYWTGNAFFFTYQTQVTFWLLGGNNILLDGGGTLDGAGQAWYDAFATNSTLLRPIIMTIFQASDVVVRDIKMVNSPEWTNFVNEGQNILFDQITINAVSTSAHGAVNTDGWDIYRSDSVVIQNSVINNGDDCVSFKPNTTNVLVSNLNCNGSHGISVGSLGQFPGVFDIVENVTAINIKMANAQNGARIKAWAGPDVGGGLVKNITFVNFSEMKVGNPLIIDQCYMTNATECAAFPSNTFIQDIWFNNITGTGTGAVVASLSCSPDGRCSNINVNDMNLSFPAGAARYTCQNVNVTGNSASFFGTCITT